MLSRILIGLVLVAVGFLIVWKTRSFIEAFGTSAWAETKLGGGGTSLMYKGIGILVIFIGFMWATNLWSKFLNATLGSIFGSHNPSA